MAYFQICPEQRETLGGRSGARSIEMEMTEAPAIPSNLSVTESEPQHHEDVSDISERSPKAEDENDENDCVKHPKSSRPSQCVNSSCADVFPVELCSKSARQAAKLPSRTGNGSPLVTESAPSPSLPEWTSKNFRRSTRIPHMDGGKDILPDSRYAKKTLFTASSREPQKNATIQSTGPEQRTEGFGGTLKFLFHKGDGHCTHEGACT